MNPGDRAIQVTKRIRYHVDLDHDQMQIIGNIILDEIIKTEKAGFKDGWIKGIAKCQELVKRVVDGIPDKFDGLADRVRRM